VTQTLKALTSPFLSLSINLLNCISRHRRRTCNPWLENPLY